MEEGQPRPVPPRRPFRAGAVSVGEVRSPAIIDYAYGLVLDRGYLKAWIPASGLTPTMRTAIADLLEEEVVRLRAEAGKVASYVNRRGGGHDAPSLDSPAAPARTADA